MYQFISVEPVTAVLGAEVGKVSLQNITDAQFAEIQQALWRHKVLFFRDQHDLTEDGHVAFGRHFGELFDGATAVLKNSTYPGAGRAEILVVANDPGTALPTDTWHTDGGAQERPASISILRARVLPPCGGDTLWANMEDAYESLTEAMKQRLALLSTHNTLARLVDYGVKKEDAERAAAKSPPVQHPIIRTHPVTGRKSVYACSQTASHIVGLAEQESEALMRDLYALSLKPDRQCRLRWRPGTVAMWDNRCVTHYATHDYFPQPRVMNRVTVRGERPV